MTIGNLKIITGGGGFFGGGVGPPPPPPLHMRRLTANCLRVQTSQMNTPFVVVLIQLDPVLPFFLSFPFFFFFLLVCNSKTHISFPSVVFLPRRLFQNWDWASVEK